MKREFIILIVLAFTANSVLANNLGQEPLYKTEIQIKYHNSSVTDSIRSKLAEMHSHDPSDILLSKGSWIVSEGQWYQRYTFNVILKDRRGPHGYDSTIIVVWVGNNDAVYKIFDKGTFSPL